MARSECGPLPSVMAPLAWCAARCYGVAVAVRNRRFDRGSGVARLEHSGRGIPVVSVGNLAAGGTGKSPFVAWAVQELDALGRVAFIAMRGYRASEGRSDEALEYAETAPKATVVVGADRHTGLLAAFERITDPSAVARAVVVLDDGFQHRRLARNLDIVLVDATRPALDGDLLPLGWLREPAEGIRRADLVVLTKADDEVQRQRAAELVLRIRGRAHDAACVHAWRMLKVFSRGAVSTEANAFLAGKRVVSACALGNPAHFHAMVEREAGRSAVHLERPDHRAFTAESLERAAVQAGAACVVVSRKDLVKLDRVPGVDLVVPDLGIRFLEGEARLREALSAALTRVSSS